MTAEQKQIEAWTLRSYLAHLILHRLEFLNFERKWRMMEELNRDSMTTETPFAAEI